MRSADAVTRRLVLGGALAATTFATLPARATPSGAPKSAPRDAQAEAGRILQDWYRLVLELVRHTATYSPPVAARAFAYLGVTAWQAAASTRSDLRSLAGQLNGLTPLPTPLGPLDAAIVMESALAAAIAHLWGNTGPTGQRAMAAMHRDLAAQAALDVPADTRTASQQHGQAIAAHILAWAATDGGEVIDNMGFPRTYSPANGPDQWVPTNKIVQQQAPLLPYWGTVRPFAMPAGSACPLPGPPPYSEDAASAFYLQAKETCDTVTNLTDDQRAVARFWSDDPMLSPTPPGHWISIILQIIERDALPLDMQADLLARTGIAMADAFIACWQEKFRFNLLRPVTYIRRLIEPAWEPLLNTPPFPEYPSGHSTQSGAAASVLTALLGDNFAFDDATHVDDNLPARSFASFWAAAQEAGMSRLYGGIHFRAAILDGLDQGRCVGAHVNALKTKV